MVVLIADVEFDKQQRILTKGSQIRKLEPKVFSLLTTLLASNKHIVTRDQLLAQVWDNRIVSEGAINRTVSLLRAHFMALTDENIIETVPTQGYRLVARVIDSTTEQTIGIGPMTHNKKRPLAIHELKKLPMIVTTLLIILVAIGGYIFKSEKRMPSHHLSLMHAPLIALKGWEYQLSVSQSGELILFHHRDKTNQQSVYLYDTQQHTQQHILSNAVAAISANGQRVVYSSALNEQCFFFVYHVLTKKKQPLFSCEEPPTALVWGQNDTFYFNKRFSKSHPYQVFSYNINTSQLRQVSKPSHKNNARGDFTFTYNHQKNQLALLRYISEEKSEIIILEAEQQIAEFTMDIPLKNLAWHHEKYRLIIADEAKLYILNTLSGQHQLLKELEIKINSIAVLPSKLRPSLLLSSSTVLTDIVKYNISSQQHKLWLESARAELLPRVQADTQVVLSTRHKEHHWWQVKHDKASLVDMSLPFPLKFLRYELSQNGKDLLFSKRGAVYEVALDSGSYQQIFPEIHHSYVVNYDTRNNTDIVYSSNQSGQWQLWHYQRAKDKHSQLTFRGGYSGRIMGEYLYYSKFAVDGLWRKKLTEPTEVLIVKDFSRINWLNWHIINNQVYFYRQASGIWQYDINTGTELLLMKKPNSFIHQYVVSPNQQAIYWVRLKPIEGDIYQYAL